MQLRGKLPLWQALSTAVLCSALSKAERLQFFFQLTNSLWIDEVGNRHPAEIINKHFVPKLWIFDLFWKRATGYCIFVLQLLCQSTTVHTSTAQSCCNFCVVGNTSATDFTVSTPLLCSANPAGLIKSYRNIKPNKTAVKVSWNGLKLNDFQFSLSNWKRALGTVHLLVSWKFSVSVFSP